MIFKKKTTSIETLDSETETFNKAIVNLIAPSAIDIYRDRIGISDNIARGLAIIKYPQELEYGWLGRLLNLKNTLSVVSFKPIDSGRFINALSANTARQNLIAETAVSPLERSRAEKIARDSEKTMRQIDENNENIGRLSVSLMTLSDDRFLEQNTRVIASACSLSHLRTRVLTSLQLDAYKQSTPFHPIIQNVEDVAGRVAPLSSVMGGFPFTSNGFNDNQGYILGKDSNNGLIIIDPWIRRDDRTNSNMIVTGIAGMGKSTAIKLIAVNELMNGTKIIFIDPEREYKDLTLKLGGDWLNIGGGENKINPLEIKPVPVDDEDDDIDLYLDETKRKLYEDEGNGLGAKALHIKTLEVFLELYLRNITTEEKALLKKTLITLYERFGIYWDTDVSKMKPSDFPTFYDLYRLLLNYAEDKNDYSSIYTHLALLIEDIAKGSDSFIWNGYTNIAPQSNIICLDTKDLQNASENIKSAQYFNALTWAWQQMSADRSEKVLLICDEGYLLADKNVPQALVYLRNIEKRDRKYEAGLIFATHSVVDLLDPSIKMYGQALLDIPAIKLIFGADGRNLKDQVELYNLTEAEEEFLASKVRKTCLLLVGSKRLKCSVEVSPAKMKIFGKAGGR